MNNPPAAKPCFATGDGIICAGLPRSGTASLAAALHMLDLGPVHHTLTSPAIRANYGWGQAAWCNLPFLGVSGLQRATDRLPFYVNPADALLPWVRADWDRLIGQQRATTDLGSVFSEQLIAAYPEARVILVDRPVEAWARSFGAVIIDGVHAGLAGFVFCVVGPWVGVPQARIARDIAFGWLGTWSREDAWRRLPEMHAEHSAMVRRSVRPGQLLVYRYEDGWAPLCEFLGVKVPDKPFPRVNDQASILQYLSTMQWKILSLAAKKLVLWSFGLGVFGFIIRRWLHWV
ncbi:efflux pump antibiotic resistance protein, putative [Cordyceps militaris CM01]|uniref:Efflux pump antibiotic resistance protein, putative n=1 Tax=Cordyceps militaris (strain CM01) TaxID=983644 RepID=G3JDK5_CORMM|nr:efflux pump antibiotic resistance protein, putative [Cordyceps militaris CM01]EGX92680.1 efflux pump antibiotic resistance protein, putative [Cordyceps militaris CM01]